MCRMLRIPFSFCIILLVLAVRFGVFPGIGFRPGSRIGLFFLARGGGGLSFLLRRGSGCLGV